MTLIVFIIVGFLVCWLLANVLSSIADSRACGGGLQTVPSRQWCRTCGAETDGPYYCSEKCYPPDEEEKE